MMELTNYASNFSLFVQFLYYYDKWFTEAEESYAQNNEAMVCLVQLWLRTKVISENSHLEFSPLLWLKQWKTISQFRCFLSWVNILSPLELDGICSFCDSSKLTALVYTFFLVYTFLTWCLSCLLILPPNARVGMKNPILYFVGLKHVLDIERRTFHTEESAWVLAKFWAWTSIISARWFTGIKYIKCW